jgi:hypothetical protein
MAGLILLFTITCGRWMIALHEAGHVETPQDIASINQAIWNTSRGLREVEALGGETVAESGSWILWRRRNFDGSS